MPTALKFRNTQKGFTLIELLVVVSLIAVLSAFLIPGFGDYIDTQNLIQAQEIVKSDLRTAQNKALTGVGSSTGIAYWGIKIPNDNNANKYDFFKSTSMNCNSVTIDSASEALPRGVVVRNAANTCIFFSVRNGDANATNLDLGYSGETPTKRVEVNSAGMIRASDTP